MHTSVRFVLDTNLLVYGVIASGPPRRLVDIAKAGVFELCTSEVALAELLDVLPRENFAGRRSRAKLTPQGIVDDLQRLAVVEAPTNVPRVVPADPDDDHVIAAAVTGQADIIASGDKWYLLPLDNFKGIPIITTREAEELLEARSQT